MPVKRRRPKIRRTNLSDLADWEKAFVEESMTQDLKEEGNISLFVVAGGPYISNPPHIVERALALWRARNEHRAAKGLPPVWPHNRDILRKIAPDEIPECDETDLSYGAAYGFPD